MKTVLLIYYNPNHDNFYYRFCHRIDLYIKDYSVGYKNSYNHEIIGILLFDDNKTIGIKNHNSLSVYYNRKNKNSKRSLKNDLIDKAISLLNKLK